MNEMRNIKEQRLDRKDPSLLTVSNNRKVKLRSKMNIGEIWNFSPWEFWITYSVLISALKYGIIYTEKGGFILPHWLEPPILQICASGQKRVNISKYSLWFVLTSTPWLPQISSLPGDAQYSMSSVYERKFLSWTMWCDNTIVVSMPMY